MSEEINEENVSRRDFLLGGLVLGGSMLLFQTGCGPGHRMMSKMVAEMKLPLGIQEFNPNFWFEVMPDNQILLRMPKAEMGQGIFTGFALLAAEELEVPYEQISVLPSSTNNALDKTGTGGSQSTLTMYIPIREVAAKMRIMLINAAAKHWNIDKKEVVAKEGKLLATGKEMTYYEVIQVTKKWEIPAKVTLKSATEFKYVGKNVKRNDLLPKVTGSAIYSIDGFFPNMLYGVLVKSPFLEGVAMKVDTSATDKVKGVEKVIVEEDFIAVVAQTRYAAEMGARSLIIDWQAPKQWTQEGIDEIVKVGVGKKREVMRKGNVNRVLNNADGQLVELTYRTPAACHAQMEPNGSVAWVEGEKATIISGLQVLPSFQKEVAKRLGIKKEDVLVQNSFLGGGFGRRTYFLDVAQVARISQIMGKPVHVFNDRTTEFQSGYFRPPTQHVFRAKQAANGQILAVDYQFASGDIILPYFPGIASFILGSDPAASHGARICYNIKPINVTTWRSTLPFKTGAWRGVGMVPNTFAVESFMDELAHQAKLDPIAFRLQHLSDKEETDIRSKKMLQHFIDKGIWARAKRENIGRGFACVEDRKTIAAAVVELSIVDNKIIIDRITSAIDAGKIINPEGVRQQIEGCAIMGMSSALYEKAAVKNNQIDVTNFHEYPLPLMADIPEIECIIFESEEEPLGVGEPPIAPIAAAIANAIFDLTGKRLRQLPLQEAWNNEG